MSMKAEIAVGLDKKLSLNYQSVGLTASIKIVKEVATPEALEGELTSLKDFLEGWVNQQVVQSAQDLPRLTQEAKQASKKPQDDIPF